MTVRAIYENGVFRPIQPVNLPENSEVEVVVPTSTTQDDQAVDQVYAILQERFRTGRTDLAERHNEHQP